MREALSRKQAPTPLAPAIQALALSVEDAATALGCGRTLVFRLIREKKLQAVHICGRTLLPVKELEAFLARLGEEATNV